jgi:hypothetical protein
VHLGCARRRRAHGRAAAARSQRALAPGSSVVPVVGRRSSPVEWAGRAPKEGLPGRGLLQKPGTANRGWTRHTGTPGKREPRRRPGPWLWGPRRRAEQRGVAGGRACPGPTPGMPGSLPRRRGDLGKLWGLPQHGRAVARAHARLGAPLRAAQGTCQARAGRPGSAALRAGAPVSAAQGTRARRSNGKPLSGSMHLSTWAEGRGRAVGGAQARAPARGVGTSLRRRIGTELKKRAARAGSWRPLACLARP